MTVAVVSHDAGGAELLSSYVRQQNVDSMFVLEGPARDVFTRKLGAVRTISLSDAVRKCDSLLCGTSWQSDLEYDAIEAARRASRRSIAFLDHWVSYRERFVRAGSPHFPDEVWVGDTLAEQIARKAFGRLPVRLVENPYLRDVRRELSSISNRREPGRHGLAVLYVCEPRRELARRLFGNEFHFGYVEEQALRYFLDHCAILGSPIECFNIRPHPSEPPNKYSWVKEQFPLPIRHGGTHSLVEEIANCDIVAGCDSMAMVVGLIAGKRVISCIPPGGRPCTLPQPQIEHLQQLVSA